MNNIFLNHSPNIYFGRKKRTPIFTPEKIPDTLVRSRENEKIAKIIDRIGKKYGDIKNPSMVQIFIHSEKCPACKKSFPLWKNITAELKRVLPTYNATEIEFDKESIFNGVGITGGEIYNWFKATGIPFIIQNFEIIIRELNNGKKYNAIKKLNTWIISYEGAISPYGFLSKIFKIRNVFVDSLLRNSQSYI